MFVEFDLLPDLMMRSVQAPIREGTIESWAADLEAGGLETRHIGPDCVPESLSLAAMLASDAWRFAERMGLIDADGPTARGAGRDAD